MAKKKLKDFVVVVTNEEEWDDPKIVIVRGAKDEDEAKDLAGQELGLDSDEDEDGPGPEYEERIAYTAVELKP